MRAWALVGVVVFGTVTGDVLQSFEMKRHGEVQFHSGSGGVSRLLSALLLKKFLILSIVCMAIAFFGFIDLLSQADLSFAVPASASSFIFETILARLVLRERVDARRWIGAVLVACGVALLAI